MKIKVELTKAQINAILWAVGNFTSGDFEDCNRDKLLYSTMQRVEKILWEVYRNKL